MHSITNYDRVVWYGFLVCMTQVISSQCVLELFAPSLGRTQFPTPKHTHKNDHIVSPTFVPFNYASPPYILIFLHYCSVYEVCEHFSGVCLCMWSGTIYLSVIYGFRMIGIHIYMKKPIRFCVWAHLEGESRLFGNCVNTLVEVACALRCHI